MTGEREGLMPDRIGRYRTERRLGSGAFATVWLGYDEQLDAQVAIKVLADNWAHDDEIRRRFGDEARILWRADSDHIIRVHSVDELPDGRPYFVMDYADRGSLEQRMSERATTRQPFPVAEAVQISLDIAAGLAVAHALGIVHRDLKPANVLFQSVGAHHGTGVDEKLVLADFGIAKSLAVGRGTTIATGTPHHMAPEQAEGRAEPRSDIYSAGIILYQLLAGQVPFPYDSIGQVLQAQRSQRPAPLSQYRSDVPPALEAAVARALEPDPTARFASAEEWAAALQTAAGEHPADTPAATPTIAPTMGPGELAAAVAASSAGLPPPPPPSPGAGAGGGGGTPVGRPPGAGGPPPPPERSRRRRRRPWFLIGGAVALVAILAGLAVAVSSSDSNGTKEGEILLTPVTSVGAIPSLSVTPFTPDFIPASFPAPESFNLPPLAIPAGSLPPVSLPGVALPTGPSSVPGSALAITTVAGAAPGLYGGTNELSTCDAKKLVEFLHGNADKAKAWAQTLGIGVNEIDSYVSQLTDVVLRADTRVTNHGFKAGAAVPIQSVLQAGTAVLVDNFGVPRVRCKCGNPLTTPTAQKKAPKFTGEPWPRFDPAKVIAVIAQQATNTFTLVDVKTAALIQHAAGMDIVKGPNEPSTTTSTTPATTPTTNAPPTTANPTTVPTTVAAQPVNITKLGQVAASSEFSAQYPVRLAVDGDPGTSWFSKGNADGNSSTYTWAIPADRMITSVSTVGNHANHDRTIRTGFGFTSVTVDLYNSAGQLVFHQANVPLPGKDPTMSVQPNVMGSRLVLTWNIHQDKACGGFGELTVIAT